MKLMTLLISAGLVFNAAAQDTTDTTKKTAPKKVTKVPDSPTIPKDATPLPDGSFRYVDKDGKKWIYRATPFGVSKSEERIVAPVVQKVSDDPTRSKDMGDSVQFTRPTPFGPKVWTTKKTELSAYEQGIWDRDQGKTTTGTAKSDDDAKPHDSAK
jgi:hypothetical protein